jgi:hypothetical protein
MAQVIKRLPSKRPLTLPPVPKNKQEIQARESVLETTEPLRWGIKNHPHPKRGARRGHEGLALIIWTHHRCWDKKLPHKEEGKKKKQ